MGGSGYREQAGAWARVARASARVHGARAGAPEANRDLFDAIELAATHGRLDLGELVDAYLAGAPDLDVGEAWGDVEASTLSSSTSSRSAAATGRSPRRSNGSSPAQTSTRLAQRVDQPTCQAA